MTDLWTAASKDIEAENRERGTARAAVALGNFAPFLLEAKSEAEFSTRIALQQEAISAALSEATEDVEARKEALMQLRTDFSESLVQRAKEARKVAAKARVAAKRRKVAGVDIVHTTGDHRVIDLGETPLSPRYKIEKNWGDESWGFVQFSSDLTEAKSIAEAKAEESKLHSTASRRTAGAGDVTQVGDYAVSYDVWESSNDGTWKSSVTVTDKNGKERTYGIGEEAATQAEAEQAVKAHVDGLTPQGLKRSASRRRTAAAPGERVRGNASHGDVVAYGDMANPLQTYRVVGSDEDRSGSFREYVLRPVDGGEEIYSDLQQYGWIFAEAHVATRRTAASEIPPGGRAISCRECHEPYRGDWSVVRCYCASGERGTVSPTWAGYGYIGPDEVISLTDSGLLYAITPEHTSSFRTAASYDEIAPGDFIASTKGLPDLRVYEDRMIRLPKNNPKKVVRIETFEDLYPSGGYDNTDRLDAIEKVEKWLGQSMPGPAQGRAATTTWVAHLDSGEIIPLDVQGVYLADKAPFRVTEPQIPGQRAWSLSSRSAAASSLKFRWASSNHLAANPYSTGNPYSPDSPATAGDPASPETSTPGVTVNVVQPESDGAQVDDEETRQQKARERINQTQMTQDLTASRRILRALVAKIQQAHPDLSQKRAVEVAQATMQRNARLVEHAVAKGRRARP